MSRKTVSIIMLSLLVMSTLTLAFKTQTVKAQPATITVPDDYPTIQAAINAANAGDTVYVRNGIYEEHIEIDKTITLTGESNQNTIIITDSGSIGCGIAITASNVTIENFNITSGIGPLGAGVISVENSNEVIKNNNIATSATDDGDTLDMINANGEIVEGNQIVMGNETSSGIGVVSYDSTVCDNTVIGGWTGIFVILGGYNNVSNNLVSNQTLSGGYSDIGAIALLLTSADTVVGNTLINNELGLSVALGKDCSAYHNNFINNTQQVLTENGSRVLFDNGYPSGGNYWSDYLIKYPNATEIDALGIGNTPYVIDANNTDYYPLMNPYSASSLFVSISPGSATLDVGQSQMFTSIATGGIPPYTYQWCLNGTAVPDAIFNSWTFTQTSPGSYTVYLNITDNAGGIATSNTANTQTALYNITFGQIGVGSDYTFTVVTIDGTSHTANDLPVSFSWDYGSTHTFAYQSPLIGEANAEQYVWKGTSGLSSLQSGSINVTTDGTITGNYKTQYNVRFDETGVGSDFSGPIVVIDGSSYNVSALPASFWYDSGSTHSFAYQSPLIGSLAYYEWNSTTGLSTLQSGSITITGAGNVTGNYLMHEVIVTNVTASTTWVYRGGIPTINVTVKNVGDFNESAVSITLYYNITGGKSVDTYPLTLSVGQSLTLPFKWNTNGVPCQNYTLTAVATIPTGSNTLSDGNISIRLLGDVNGDGRVDLRDIALVARALGSTPSSPNWNPAADLNGDSVVNMKDIALVARNFGLHYP